MNLINKFVIFSLWRNIFFYSLITSKGCSTKVNRSHLFGRATRHIASWIKLAFIIYMSKRPFIIFFLLLVNPTPLVALMAKAFAYAKSLNGDNIELLFVHSYFLVFWFSTFQFAFFSYFIFRKKNSDRIKSPFWAQ